MSAAEAANASTVRRLFEAFNQGNLDALDVLLTAHPLAHTPFPVPEQSRPGWKESLTALRVGFPDMRMTIEDLISQGDEVVVRWTGQGTHRGVYRGLTP